MVEGNSGVIGYCELNPHKHLKMGDEIQEGESIGLITPVLKKNKGNGRTMLHFELYYPGTKEHATWLLDTEKPISLQNPRTLLEGIK